MDWLQERRHEVDWGKHVHPTFAWGCSRDWCKSGEFLRGRGSVRFGWSFTSQSLPYVNFKVAILEAAYKWKWFWIEILDTWQWLPQFSMSYCPLNDTSVNDVTSLISLDYVKLTLKFINWHASCLMYPSVVLAVNKPSVNFASWKTSCAVRWEMIATQRFHADGSWKEHSEGLGLADILWTRLL